MIIGHDIHDFIEDWYQGAQPTTQQILDLTRAIDYDSMACKKHDIYEKVWAIYRKGKLLDTVRGDNVYRAAYRIEKEYRQLNSKARHYWEKV